MQIKNEVLTASFKTIGAELCSLINNKNGREYIWQGDSNWWPRHAPVLFPIVGKLRNNEYQFEGKTYQMGQHGFARDMAFSVAEHQTDCITFALQDSEQTRQIYPFQFEFRIEYRLIESSLHTTFLVQNKGLKEMPFSCGGHPAFNASPINNYFLSFDKELANEIYVLEGGLISTEPLTSKGGQVIWFTKNTFDKDALIFLDTSKTRITLNHADHGPVLTLNTIDFPLLGIWSKPGASFVCIEPWQGTADWEDSDGQIIHKKGIVILKSNKSYLASFSIEVVI